jgi:hypothetical protein
MHLCGARAKKDPHERARAHTSFRFTKEQRDEIGAGIGAGVRQTAPRGYGGAPEPEPEQRDSVRGIRAGQRTASGRGRDEVEHRGGSETARDQSVHHVRQTVVPPWTRQKLSSQWTEEKASFVGEVGLVISTDHIGNQLELSFGEAHLMRKLIYPVGALGLRKKSQRGRDGPLEDASLLLGLGLYDNRTVEGVQAHQDEDGRILRHPVQAWCDENDWEVLVRDDPKLV